MLIHSDGNSLTAAMTGSRRVMWLGLRGFPGVQGGVEIHAEHLCPLLAEIGCEMHVATRGRYQPREARHTWKGVRIHNLWAPQPKQLETLGHSILAVLYAGLVLRPDVLHIQAIGPGIVTPLARLLGLRVVVTHHGEDYERQKWGRVAKAILKWGERMSMAWAHEVIVISQHIQRLVLEKYGRPSHLIPNGVDLMSIPASKQTLEMFGLEPRKYVLLVSRIVPEKRHLDLIEAFKRAGPPGWKLVLVGRADHHDKYANQVRQAAKEASPAVVLTGLQTGSALHELYAHAGFFVLPSSHEGLPIALLEALSFGLRVVASNIPANLEIGLPPDAYFVLGQINELAERISGLAEQVESPSERTERQVWVAERYNWHQVAESTSQVYRALTLTSHP